ncbi:MAG: DUF2070 family protein [Thermoplasmatota archaeon]
MLTFIPFSLEGFTKSITIFLIPFIISTSLLPIYKGYQIDFKLKHSSLLALFTMFLTLIAIHLLLYFEIGIKVSIIISYASTISIRYLLIRGGILSKPFRSIPISFFQPVIALPFLYIFYPFLTYDIILFILICLVSLVPIGLSISVVNRPFLSEYGTTAMDMIRIFSQLLLGNKNGLDELEKVLESDSVVTDIEYTVFSFKTEERTKALFVTSQLHPGPLKGVGGSNLSGILSKHLQEFGEIFHFHGTTTHSLNPLHREDCSFLPRNIRNDLKNIDHIPYASEYITTNDGAAVSAQVFGDSLFMTSTFSPDPTEDIDAAIGKIISLKAEEQGYETVGFVDSHNSCQEGCKAVHYPMKRYDYLMNSTENTVKKIKDVNLSEFKMGVACRKNYEKSKGISSEGIKAAVFSVNGKKNAYVLIDGNNMVKGLREEIKEGIKDLVDESEIATTDTHEVHTIKRDHNPVGLNMSRDEIIEDVSEVVKLAIEDLEKVEVGSHKGSLHDIKVMGPNSTEKISAIGETVYKIAPLTLLLSLLVQGFSISLVVSFL